MTAEGSRQSIDGLMSLIEVMSSIEGIAKKK
jgi:hypothetical protein